jgi:glycosyltransferase involved in cell wall biosynthesis
MRSVLLIVVNDPVFFLSHRLPVAEGARRAGFDVHIATKPGRAVEDIRALGFEHHALPLTRSGRNPFAELKAFFFLWCLLWRLRPDVLHLVTIKPVLYGGIAARLAPVKGVVAAISGLGFVFLASGFKARLMRGLVSLLYRFALGKEKLLAIFQNPDDRDALIKLGALASHKTVLIRGSGVRLSAYQVFPEPEADAVVVTLAARLLRDKGVGEFVEAARVLKARGIDAVFQLVGDLDPDNPASVTLAELENWRSGKDVVVMGYRQDIANVFAASHLVVLPSYREGLPKVLVEAAACGRAVVTTDVPGCRDAIDPNVTGLLVPVRDVGALADAMEKLIKDPSWRQRIGKAGRELAEREFAIEKIVKQHLTIYEKLRDGA